MGSGFWDASSLEASKEISKTLFFFFGVKPVHALSVIETNRQSESTERFEFAPKNIGSAFLDLFHGLAKRPRVKFPKKPTYLTLRRVLLGDFCGHSLNKQTERTSYFRLPHLYEVNEYFEKAGLGSRMLSSKDLFNKSIGFVKRAAILKIQFSFFKYTKSLT